MQLACYSTILTAAARHMVAQALSEGTNDFQNRMFGGLDEKSSNPFHGNGRNVALRPMASQWGISEVQGCPRSHSGNCWRLPLRAEPEEMRVPALVAQPGPLFA